jgi:hypothetical protein
LCYYITWSFVPLEFDDMEVSNGIDTKYIDPVSAISSDLASENEEIVAEKVGVFLEEIFYAGFLIEFRRGEAFLLAIIDSPESKFDGHGIEHHGHPY